MSKRDEIACEIKAEFRAFHKTNEDMLAFTDSILAIAFKPSEGDEARARAATDLVMHQIDELAKWTLLNIEEHELRKVIMVAIARALAEARAEGEAAERKRCAKIAEKMIYGYWGPYIAAAIRKGDA